MNNIQKITSGSIEFFNNRINKNMTPLQKGVIALIAVIFMTLSALYIAYRKRLRVTNHPSPIPSPQNPVVPPPLAQPTQPQRPPQPPQPPQQTPPVSNPPPELTEAETVASLKGRIKWMTGTTSAALALMLNDTVLARLGRGPALVPNSMLLEHQVVPLSGELMSIQNFISGVAPADVGWALRYANYKEGVTQESLLKRIYETEAGPNKYPNPEQVHFAVLKLLLTGEASAEYPKIKHHIQTKVIDHLTTPVTDPNWEQRLSLIQTNVLEAIVGQAKPFQSSTPIVRGQLVGVMHDGDPVMKFAMMLEASPRRSFYRIIPFKNGCYCDVQNLFMIDEAVLQTLQIPPQLTGQDLFTMKRTLMCGKEKFQVIMKLFDEVQPLLLTDFQRQMRQAGFPMVIASTTIQSDALKPVRGMGGRPGELMVFEPVPLGPGVIVFADAPHIPQLQEELRRYQVEVLNLNLLRQMTTGLFRQMNPLK